MLVKEVAVVAWSDSEQFVAFVGRNGNVDAWQVEPRQPLWSLRGPAAANVEAAVMSNSGKTAWLTTSDGALHRSVPERGSWWRVCERGGGRFLTGAPTDGSLVLGSGTTVRVDADGNGREWAIADGWIEKAVVVPDGLLVALTRGDEFSIECWARQGDDERVLHRAPGRPHAVCLQRDGSFAAIAQTAVRGEYELVIGSSAAVHREPWPRERLDTPHVSPFAESIHSLGADALLVTTAAREGIPGVAWWQRGADAAALQWSLRGARAFSISPRGHFVLAAFAKRERDLLIDVDRRVGFRFSDGSMVEPSSEAPVKSAPRRKPAASKSKPKADVPAYTFGRLCVFATSRIAALDLRRQILAQVRDLYVEEGASIVDWRDLTPDELALPERRRNRRALAPDTVLVYDEDLRAADRAWVVVHSQQWEVAPPSAHPLALALSRSHAVISIASVRGRYVEYARYDGGRLTEATFVGSGGVDAPPFSWERFASECGGDADALRELSARPEQLLASLVVDKIDFAFEDDDWEGLEDSALVFRITPRAGTRRRRSR